MSERKKAVGISKEIFQLLKEQAAPGQEQQLTQVTIDEDLPSMPSTGGSLPRTHELYRYLKDGAIRVGPDTPPGDLELFKQYQIPVDAVGVKRFLREISLVIVGCRRYQRHLDNYRILGRLTPHPVSLKMRRNLWGLHHRKHMADLI